MRQWPSLVLLGLGFLYATLLFSPQVNSQDSVVGRFHILSLKPHKTPFQKGLLYTGSFQMKGHSAIPCSLFMNKKMAANRDYLIEGKLKKTGILSYQLKAKRWKSIEPSFSWAESRFWLKNTLRTFLHKKITDRRAQSLLDALLTGDLSDRLLRYEFQRLGLSHILAVSGFHFGVIFCLFLILCQRRYWVLLFLVTLYYLFIGPNPATSRAYLIASLYCFAKILKKSPSGFNLLGVALLFEVTFHPEHVLNLGFQLSYVSCLGLLLSAAPIDGLLSQVLPQRPKRALFLLPLFSQWLTLISTYLRKSLALVLAVHLAIWPLLLYHFQKIPILSLFYNLFFPWFISIGFVLLLLALGTYLLFPSPLFWMTDSFTAHLLDLTSYPPYLLDYAVYGTFSAPWIPIYLFIYLFFVKLRISKNVLNCF